MNLRCTVCRAIQPVTVADEADEDLRTQGIRRAFRAAHAASCGEGSVLFTLAAAGVTEPDQTLWPAYLAHVQPPNDVTLQADGFFLRAILRDGVTHHVRVCEDCWRNIPRYVEFPQGLISPESDGGPTVPAKVRPDTVDTSSPARASAATHLWKAVCVPCYQAAFRRMYPEAPVTDLCEDVIGDGQPVELAPPPDMGHHILSMPASEAV